MYVFKFEGGKNMDAKQLASLLDQAAEKSLKDKAFREELVKDAKAAIKKEFDKELPVKVTFHEATAKKLVFTLPPQEEENKELDDTELTDVAGGNGLYYRMSSTPKMAMTAYGCAPALPSVSGEYVVTGNNDVQIK